jgi:hypothetical protein
MEYGFYSARGKPATGLDDFATYLFSLPGHMHGL